MSCDLDYSKLIQSVKCPNVGGQKGGNCNPNYQSFSINKGCNSYNIPSASELAWDNRYSSQKGGKVNNTNFNNATESEFIKEGINVNSCSQNAWINRFKQMGGNEMKYLSAMYIDSIFYYVDEKNLKSKLNKIFSSRFSFTVDGKNESNQEKFEKHILRMKLQMQRFRTKILEGDKTVNIIFYLGRNKVEEHEIKISRNRIRTINIITKFSNKQKGGKSNLTCYSMNVNKGINGSPEVNNCCTVNPSELLRGGKNKKRKQKGGGGGNGYTIAVNKPPIGGRPEIDGYVEGCLPFFPGGTSSPRTPSNGKKGGVALKKVGKKVSKKSGKSGNSLINLKGINKKQKAKLKNMKKIYILNNENNQLYFHFDDLDKIIKFKQIKNINLTNEPTKIIVRWYDFYNEKNYKTNMTLKKALKKGLLLIKNIIKNKNMNLNTLNSSGLIYVLKNKNTIFIEPQFS